MLRCLTVASRLVTMSRSGPATHHGLTREVQMLMIVDMMFEVHVEREEYHYCRDAQRSFTVMAQGFDYIRRRREKEPHLSAMVRFVNTDSLTTMTRFYHLAENSNTPNCEAWSQTIAIQFNPCRDTTGNVWHSYVGFAGDFELDEDLCRFMAQMENT